nr:immunoglobulin light chain junction region [Macaca mulatta]
CALFYNVAWVF